MEVACPSCKSLFEVDEAEAALPGIPICEACQLRAGAPDPRRAGQRPKAPGLSRDAAQMKLAIPGRPAETLSTGATDDVDLSDLDDQPVPSSDGAPVSMSELEIVPGSGRSPEASLDAGLSGEDADPVSLRDLQAVLSPGAEPPRWTGGDAQAPRAPMDLGANEPPPPFGRRRRPVVPVEGLSPRPPDSSLADLQIMEALSPQGAAPPRAPEAARRSNRAPTDSSLADLAVMAALCPPSPATQPEAPKPKKPAASLDLTPTPLAGAIVEKRPPPHAPPKPIAARPAASPPPPKVVPAPPKAAPPKAAPPEPEEALLIFNDDKMDDAGPTSGLLDIRSLAISAAKEDPEPTSDSDLFNLSGGGMFTAPARSLEPVDLSLLTSPIVEPPPDSGSIPFAPVLDAASLRGLGSHPPPAKRAGSSAAPVVAKRKPAAAAAAKRSGLANRAVLIAALGVAAIVAAFRFGRGGREDAPGAKTDAIASQAIPAATPTDARPADRPANLPIAREPSVDDAPAKSSAKVEPSATPSARPSATPAVKPPGGGDPSRPPPDLPPATKVAPPPAVTPAAPPAPPPVTAGAEFNRDAARAALANAAAAAAGCKKPDDPPGGAKVSITFAASGRVTTARVTGPPFQGTPTGGCIASAFRAATVPPFEGAAVTVNKDVNIR